MGRRAALSALVRAILVLVAGLSVVGACGSDTNAKKDEGSGKATTKAGSTAPNAKAGERGSKTIPQPIVPGDIPVAPESKRVDLSMPTFSDPTNVTNPLFPVSRQESVLMVGHVDGKPFRTEVTLLPETRIIEWQGQRIETLVSQYTAYLDGRIQEVAYDLYAQADDGSVWYFGRGCRRLRGRRYRDQGGHLDRWQGRSGRDDHALQPESRRCVPDRK
jgi:hypothetical protein